MTELPYKNNGGGGARHTLQGLKAVPLKALANEDTLLRTHCCQQCVRNNVSSFTRAFSVFSLKKYENFTASKPRSKTSFYNLGRELNCACSFLSYFFVKKIPLSRRFGGMLSTDE